MKNTQVKLLSRPIGVPKEANFSVETTALPALTQGEVLVKNLYLSIDPAMRSWMTEGKSYINPVPVGGVMRALGTGVVVDSRNPDYKPGDYVYASLGVQEYALVTEDYLTDPTYGRRPYHVDPVAAPLPTYLGPLGLPGMTAYFGLLRVGQLQPGETVVISGAAGGVGSTAGQIARLKGCRVIGITSSDEKCATVVDRFGFDACLNYKSGTLRDELAALAPDGVDLFFDNVGGDVLNAGLGSLRRGGRVVISGAVSQYNNMQFMRGPAGYLSLIVNRARMEGFVVIDFQDQFAEARAEIARWIQAGLVNPETHVVRRPVTSFVDMLSGLFAGQNTGKMVLEIENYN